jgi:hypothetical protein
MGEKRIEKLGHDPIRDKFYKDYSKKRKGLKHTDQIKENKEKFSND